MGTSQDASAAPDDDPLIVSIQLMSPASGDYEILEKVLNNQDIVSIQLMSPASGDLLLPIPMGLLLSSTFPFN